VCPTSLVTSDLRIDSCFSPLSFDLGAVCLVVLFNLKKRASSDKVNSSTNSHKKLRQADGVPSLSQKDTAGRSVIANPVGYSQAWHKLGCWFVDLATFYLVRCYNSTMTLW